MKREAELRVMQIKLRILRAPDVGQSTERFFPRDFGGNEATYLKKNELMLQDT